MTSFTSSSCFRDVICLVPDTIVLLFLILMPFELSLILTIRRYPHQLDASPAPHNFMGVFNLELLRSHVLNATGMKYSSTTRLMIGSENIPRPAS